MKKYLCAITLALLFIESVQAQECYPTPAGIVGWWMGEGVALDSISGSNGVIYSGTTFTAGMVGEAFSFDGGTGCVMNDQTTPLTDIQNTFTIEFWAYPQKGINLPPQDGSGYPGISGQSYAIFPNFGGYDGKAGAGVSLGTNGIAVMEHADNYLASLLTYTNSINGWVHVAVVYTNKQPALYLNGVLVQTGLTSSRTFVYPSKDLGGSSQYSSYGPYQGLLDEISIYNRALTSTEIQGIYNARNGGKNSNLYPPLITGQPTSQISSFGQSVNFGVMATGTDPLNYQWSLNNDPIIGATNQTLTITNIQSMVLGSYFVVVSNIYGSVTSSIANLATYPYLSSEFAGLTANWGANATLKATALGSGPLSYQWYQNGVAIQDGTNQVLELASLGFAQGGLYTVVVSNSYGSVTNTPQMLVVNPTPPYLEVNANLNCYIQNETNLNNQIATIAQPIRQKLSTRDILDILAKDEFLKGNWASNSFSKNAALELLNGSFFVSDGTNILLNVSDLLTYETGEPKIIYGKQNVVTGLANHSLQVSQMVNIVYDDTKVVGGGKLVFYLYGISNETTEDANPNNGIFVENKTVKISTLIGDGYIGDTPIVIVGLFSASGKAKLQIAE